MPGQSFGVMSCANFPVCAHITGEFAPDMVLGPACCLQRLVVCVHPVLLLDTISLSSIWIRITCKLLSLVCSRPALQGSLLVPRCTAGWPFSALRGVAPGWLIERLRTRLQYIDMCVSIYSSTCILLYVYTCCVFTYIFFCPRR